MAMVRPLPAVCGPTTTCALGIGLGPISVHAVVNKFLYSEGGMAATAACCACITEIAVMRCFGSAVLSLSIPRLRAAPSARRVMNSSLLKSVCTGFTRRGISGSVSCACEAVAPRTTPQARTSPHQQAECLFIAERRSSLLRLEIGLSLLFPRI